MTASPARAQAAGHRREARRALLAMVGAAAVYLGLGWPGPVQAEVPAHLRNQVSHMTTVPVPTTLPTTPTRMTFPPTTPPPQAANPPALVVPQMTTPPVSPRTGADPTEPAPSYEPTGTSVYGRNSADPTTTLAVTESTSPPSASDARLASSEGKSQPAVFVLLGMAVVVLVGAVAATMRKLASR